VKKIPQKLREVTSEEENELRIGPFPLVTANYPASIIKHKIPPNPNSQTTSPLQPSRDTPNSDYHDPTYFPPETPKLGRELQTTRNEPSVTRSRARILPQSHIEL